jgi:hypothetical protein
LIRDHAFDEALDASKLETLARYEMHLDRKLERMLSMLFRLMELRQTPASMGLKFLLQPQAVPRHRNSLQQDRHQLPRPNTPRRHHHLAQLRTRPSVPIHVDNQRVSVPMPPAAVELILRTV